MISLNRLAKCVLILIGPSACMWPPSPRTGKMSCLVSYFAYDSYVFSLVGYTRQPMSHPIRAKKLLTMKHLLLADPLHHMCPEPVFRKPNPTTIANVSWLIGPCWNRLGSQFRVWWNVDRSGDLVSVHRTSKPPIDRSIRIAIRSSEWIILDGRWLLQRRTVSDHWNRVWSDRRRKGPKVLPEITEVS